MAVLQEEFSYYKVTLFKSESPILSFLWSPLRPRALSSKFTTNAIQQQKVITRGSCLIMDFLASRIREAGTLPFMKHSVERVPPTAKENRLKQHPNKLPHGLKEIQQQSREHGSGHKIERPRGTLCFCYALEKNDPSNQSG